MSTGPGDTTPPTPGGDVVPTAPPSGRPRRRATVITAVGAVVLLLVGGGAFAAYSVLNGGGPQPEDALPAGVIAYAEVDLDPGAGQKLSAYRLSQKLPDGPVKGEGSVKDDLLRSLFDSADDVSYDVDVKPWIGDRAGVAVLAPEDDEDGGPTVVAAVQYRDRGKAEAGLRRLVDTAGGDAGYAFGADDYVVLASTTEIAEKAVADARRGALADDDRYEAALDALGGDTVATAYLDLEQLPEGLLSEAGPFGADARGAYVVGISLSSDAIELRGTGVGVSLGGLGEGLARGGDGELLASLPENSLAGLSLVGLDGPLRSAYEELTGQQDGQDAFGAQEVLDRVAAAGVRLPDELSALLGEETALAVLPGQGDEPEVGVRTRGGDPQRGNEALPALVEALEEPGAAGQPAPPVLSRVDADEDGLLVGSAPQVLDALDAAGRLGSTEAFRKAVPRADAPFAFFIHVAAILDDPETTGGIGGAGLEQLEPIEAVGFSAQGSAFRLRVTFR